MCYECSLGHVRLTLPGVDLSLDYNAPSEASGYNSAGLAFPLIWITSGCAFIQKLGAPIV